MLGETRTLATLLGRSPSAFALMMGGCILVVLIVGFHYPVGDALIRAAPRPPTILYLHALVAGAWIPFVVLQPAFVHARRAVVHRRLGMWGMVHGAL